MRLLLDEYLTEQVLCLNGFPLLVGVVLTVLHIVSSGPNMVYPEVVSELPIEFFIFYILPIETFLRANLYLIFV